jgi:hypothetical protein
MKKNLKWRLTKLPTSEEVNSLVLSKIISQEEAKDILFTEVDEKEKSVSDLEAEVKFLKELIEKLGNRTQIIENIRYIEKPYYVQPWYQPYQVWCSSGNQLSAGTSGTMYLSASNTTGVANAIDVNFSAIS